LSKIFIYYFVDFKADLASFLSFIVFYSSPAVFLHYNSCCCQES